MNTDRFFQFFSQMVKCQILRKIRQTDIVAYEMITISNLHTVFGRCIFLKFSLTILREAASPAPAVWHRASGTARGQPPALFTRWRLRTVTEPALVDGLSTTTTTTTTTTTSLEPLPFPDESGLAGPISFHSALVLEENFWGMSDTGRLGTLPVSQPTLLKQWS